MPTFKYIGGTTTSEHFSETSEGPVDEINGVEMPDSTTAFGIKFIVNQPVDVTLEKFPNNAAYQHALKKLAGNKFFKQVTIEDAVFEEVEPDVVKPEKKKPGPKAKAKTPMPEDLGPGFHVTDDPE